MLRRHHLIAAMFAALPVILVATERSAAQRQSSFSFAVIGDLGYVSEEEPWVENVFSDLNKDSSLSFVVHVGDLSSPRNACRDDFQTRRLAQFEKSSHPLIYTPGDNDWTDCHEPTIAGGNPLERLSRLRTLFFAGDQSLGQRKIALKRQSQSADPILAKHRENVRWDMGGVTFITLHVVGSNNGLGRWPEGDEEYAERKSANLAWLREGFEHARAAGSRAVMILQQANIFPSSPPFPDKEGNPSGITEVRTAIEKEATAFRQPVVLVHGDSHYFRLDNPFWQRPPRGQRAPPALENFLRLETFGTPNHHWVKITVDPDNPNVFSFWPRIVAANVIKRE